MAKDITYYSVGEAPQPYLYVPLEAIAPSIVSFHVRVTGDVDLAQALRRELRQTDPRVRVPLASPYTLLRQVQMFPSRAMASISVAFGVLALLLTVVGVYGVVSYAVGQRTPEFALRIALGAVPGDILKDVLRHGFLMTAGGLAVGVALALALARTLRGFLFGVSLLDPFTFGGWMLLLIAITLVAAYVPARRATRIDPAAALTRRY